MKFTKFLFLGLLVTIFIASCGKPKCKFEMGSRGVINKFDGGPQNGGLYYIGDTSSFAAHMVLIANDPSIDLEAVHQSGLEVVIHCNYVRQQAANNQLIPALLDVIHVHNKSFIDY